MKPQKKFHLVGVGGIGMSALARMLVAQKYSVSGSDLNHSLEVQELKRYGVNIFNEHASENIEEESIVVYSTAIDDNNPEIMRAKVLNCPLWHRSELLKYLMQKTYPLSVAGTHGKTSTSALLTHVLKVAMMDPSYVIGGILVDQKTNSEQGKGPYFVLEADESDGSLVQYHSHGAIVTNIEEDHLGYFYTDLEHIKSTLAQFIDQVDEEKAFFWCKDCPNLNEMNPKGLSYGFDPGSDLRIYDYAQHQTQCTFSVDFQGTKIKEIKLALMGRHNALNAVSVLGMALYLSIPLELIREAFLSFKGVRRRSEKIGMCHQIQFYDDYAHHPTEVKAVLKSFRKAYPKRRLIALFQPHRYSRIEHLEKEFAESFSKASEVWLTDVYAAKEPKPLDFSLQAFAKHISEQSKVHVRVISKDQLNELYLNSLKPLDVLISMGAGDISSKARDAFFFLRDQKVSLKIGLIYGAQSPEHYISKISKNFVLEGLKAPWYDIEAFEIDLQGNWRCSHNKEPASGPLSSEVYARIAECDFFFPVVHGPNGEDGMIQGFLKTLKKPFAGPQLDTCALVMNKHWCKQVIKKAGVCVAEGVLVKKKNYQNSAKALMTQIESQYAYPLIVKPNNLGSSLGIQMVRSHQELHRALKVAFELCEEACVEERIIGREFEAVVFEGEVAIYPYPGEVLTRFRSYDYEAKYSKNPIEKVPLADIPKKWVEKSRKMAKTVFDAIHANGFIRIDFFIDRSGKLICGEVNAIPGMTPRSLFPRILKNAGLNAHEVCESMMIQGLYEHRIKEQQALALGEFANTLKHVTE